jgi:uncharacterized protein YutE (UPF0331/DUF86 family)
MSKEFILKKLKQIVGLLSEMEELFAVPFSEFSKKFTNIRSAERSFQLLVEQSSDINNHIVLESGGDTPETYRASFTQIEKLGIITKKLSDELVKSAILRNILIHEYDFDEDNFIFYKSAKKFIPVYREYVSSIEAHIQIS